jgi:hypothetical protein
MGCDDASGPHSSEAQRALNDRVSLCGLRFGLMRVRPVKKRILIFSKTNFYSTQKSIENWEKYLGTSGIYETFYGDRIEHLEQLCY